MAGDDRYFESKVSSGHSGGLRNHGEQFGQGRNAGGYHHSDSRDLFLKIDSLVPLNTKRMNAEYDIIDR